MPDILEWLESMRRDREWAYADYVGRAADEIKRLRAELVQAAINQRAVETQLGQWRESCAMNGVCLSAMLMHQQ